MRAVGAGERRKEIGTAKVLAETLWLDARAGSGQMRKMLLPYDAPGKPEAERRGDGRGRIFAVLGAELLREEGKHRHPRRSRGRR